jgi:hypothetical protein
MKKLTILLLTVCVITAGCTGSFMLTKKVYNFHRQQEGKWVDELVFLGVVIIPVYGLATLGDAIIFNSIEFWSGENPIKASSKESSVVISANDDLKVILNYLTENNGIRIDSYASDKQTSTFILERSDSGVMAKDVNGLVLYKAISNEQGGISVYSKENELVEHFSPNMVHAMMDNMGVQYN